METTVGDKEQHTSPTTVSAELEYAVRGENTMHTLGHSSRLAQLPVAIERVEIASLCIEGEGDRRQGCLLILHLLVHLL
jgi:hypothetical protein